MKMQCLLLRHQRRPQSQISARLSGADRL